VDQLAAAIAAVVAETGWVKKDGKHAQGWAYASSEAILGELRQACAKHGVIIIPRVVSLEELDAAKGRRVRASMVFTVAHSSGQLVEVPWISEVDGFSDTISQKAYTMAHREFLRQLFLVPRGDDPEASEAPKEEPKQAPPPSKNKARRLLRELAEELAEGVEERIGPAEVRIGTRARQYAGPVPAEITTEHIRMAYEAILQEDAKQ
jgi:hypothetical protein